MRAGSRNESGWWYGVGGVIVIFLWLAATAGWRRFTAPDEGRYAGVALEMLRSGDWWVPRLDGLPFFHKPPLFYWLGAASMAVFGPNEWAARLPSLIGATLGAGALFLFVGRWVDRSVAKLATVVLVTMPFFYIGAQFANLDMLVAGCIGATVLCAAHAALLREASQRWRLALLGAFVFAALGVLAKGLIGFVLPGAIFLGWCVLTKRHASLRLFAWWPGWLVFLAIAAPWFFAMQRLYPGFYDYFVVTQHFRRFAASGFNNAHPFWFYLPVIAVLSLPWVVWSGVIARRRGDLWATGSEVDALMLVWFVVIVVFFSIPRSKLIGYVLPALPPLAWFLARICWHAMGVFPRAVPAWKWSCGVAVALCLASVVAGDRFGTPPGARLSLPAGQAIGADDQVLMVDAYYYEIPFYWKLDRPVKVLTDWRPENLAHSDNWRNELRDAGRFEPDKAAVTLIGPEALARTLCGVHSTWIVGSSAAVLHAPWLADARFVLVANNGQVAVWRFAGSASNAPDCLRITPSPSSISESERAS